MKQLVSNLKILKKNIWYSFKLDTAFSSSTWAFIFVAFFFGVFTALFAELMYSKISNINGYSKNDMLIFLMIGTFNFYIVSNNIEKNLENLSKAVNSGTLDLILTKPVSSLFYVSTSYISIFSVLTHSIPNIIPYLFLIDFSVLEPTIFESITFLLLFPLGWIGMQFTAFILTISVFWIGKNENVSKLYTTFDYRLGRLIPFDIAPESMKILFGIFIPVMIQAGITTSVLLGNSKPLPILLFFILLIPVLLFIEGVIWKFALRAYTSASS